MPRGGSFRPTAVPIRNSTISSLSPAVIRSTRPSFSASTAATAVGVALGAVIGSVIVDVLFGPRMSSSSDGNSMAPVASETSSKFSGLKAVCDDQVLETCLRKAIQDPISESFSQTLLSRVKTCLDSN